MGECGALIGRGMARQRGGRSSVSLAPLCALAHSQAMAAILHQKFRPMYFRWHVSVFRVASWDARPNMVALLCACAGKEWEGRDEGWGTSRAHHGGPQKSRLRFSV